MSRNESAAATIKRRSRAWWFWRFVRAYHKHGVLRSRGLRGAWRDAMIARRSMAPAEQWKLDPIKRASRV